MGAVVGILIAPTVGPVFAGMIGGAVAGAISGAFEGGLGGALKGAAFGAAIGGIMGGAFSGLEQIGQGFGYGFLGAAMAGGATYAGIAGGGEGLANYAAGTLGALSGAQFGNTLANSFNMSKSGGGISAKKEIATQEGKSNLTGVGDAGRRSDPVLGKRNAEAHLGNAASKGKVGRGREYIMVGVNESTGNTQTIENKLPQNTIWDFIQGLAEGMLTAAGGTTTGIEFQRVEVIKQEQMIKVLYTMEVDYNKGAITTVGRREVTGSEHWISVDKYIERRMGIMFLDPILNCFK